MNFVQNGAQGYGHLGQVAACFVRVVLDVLYRVGPSCGDHALVEFRIEEREGGAWPAFVVQCNEDLFVDAFFVFGVEDRLCQEKVALSDGGRGCMCSKPRLRHVDAPCRLHLSSAPLLRVWPVWEGSSVVCRMSKCRKVWHEGSAKHRAHLVTE